MKQTARWHDGMTAIGLLALAALFAVVPSCRLAAQGAPALRVPYETFTLPNGLQVIVHEDRSVPVVAVNTWYHVGSGDEHLGRTGFAHLFEHLMFMGLRETLREKRDATLRRPAIQYHSPSGSPQPRCALHRIGTLRFPCSSHPSR